MMKDVELAKYIEIKREEPFQWGVCDCVLFTADWCEIITGINPANGAHGKYDSELSAYKYLKKEWNNDTLAYADLYFERVDSNFAQIGDICLCDLYGRDTFGICGHNGFVFFKSERIEIRKIEKKIVWRIE